MDLQKISVPLRKLGLIALIVFGFCFTTGNAANKVPISRVEVPLESPAPENPATSVPTDGIDNSATDSLNANAALEIQHDLSILPAAVRETHTKILAAAASGDIENLRPFIKLTDNATNLSLGGFEGDPIEFLKATSGDPKGQELLAILTEILEAGFVRMDADTEEELFVWPYFFAVSLDKLTPPQRVGLFRILTFGDLEESLSFGGYIFYRTAIRPDGTWSFFLTGD